MGNHQVGLERGVVKRLGGSKCSKAKEMAYYHLPKIVDRSFILVVDN